MTYSVIMLLGILLGGAASGGLTAASMKASPGTIILCAVCGLIFGIVLGPPSCKFSASLLTSKKFSAPSVVLLHLLIPLLSLLIVILGTGLAVRVVL